MSTRSEYLRLACLLILASAASSIPSSYLSSITGGDGGMTWMGWAPQTGMTAFASSSNPWYQDRGWKNTGVELEPPSQEAAGSQQEEEEQPPKKWNKPRDDNDDDNRPGTSKAEASLNAWFPIMLGLFPPQGEDSRKQQPEQGWENAKSIAAVANSVNHGSRGVASSHAVAFGGEPPNYRSRTVNRNLDTKEKTPREQFGGQTPQEQYGGQAPALQDQYGAPTAQPQPKFQQYYKQLKRYANSAY